MRKLAKLFFDLVLYGNFWIALGALALVWQSQLIIQEQPPNWEPLAAFVFCATLLLYALHRIVGILRLKNFLALERYRVIARFRRHIIVYAVVAGLASCYYFFLLPWSIKIMMGVPTLLSLGYVLPLFGRQRRLRDFDQIKIFLVAGVWAGVTVVLPAALAEQLWQPTTWLMALERALFIFAITLPFDIRDLEVDAHSQVGTLPARLGLKRSLRLAWWSLAAAIGLAVLIYSMGLYSAKVLLAIIITYALTAILIAYAHPKRHDYYYSGLMDGTMLGQFLVVYLLHG